jgi:hypothetical protein
MKQPGTLKPLLWDELSWLEAQRIIARGVP